MGILTDSRHPHRLEIVDTGRRRRWSDAAKLRVVEESFSEPRIASATARRHGISNQLIFAWRKAYREGRLNAGPVSGFVPAVVVPDPPARAESVGRLEIVTGNGRRVLVDCGVDVDPQAWLADVLARINDMPQARLAELLPWNWSAVTHQEQPVAA